MELLGRRWQGSSNGDVRASAAMHPWMSVAVVASAAAAAAVLALLGLRWGWAADTLAHPARSRPMAAAR